MSTTTVDPARLAVANQASAAVRSRLAVALEDLRSGALTLSALLADLPPELERVPIHRFVAAQRGFGRLKLEKLNRAAMAAGVNLFLPAGRVGQRSRLWLAEHAVAVVGRPCEDCGEPVGAEGRRWCRTCSRSRAAARREQRAARYSEARRLREEGLSYAAIGERLGVHQKAAWAWVNSRGLP